MDLLIIPIPVTQEKILHGLLSLACSHSVDALQHFYGLSTALLWMPYSTSVDYLQHFCGLSTALLWIIYSISSSHLWACMREEIEVLNLGKCHAVTIAVALKKAGVSTPAAWATAAFRPSCNDCTAPAAYLFFINQI